MREPRTGVSATTLWHGAIALLVVLSLSTPALQVPAEPTTLTTFDANPTPVAINFFPLPVPGTPGLSAGPLVNIPAGAVVLSASLTVEHVSAPPVDLADALNSSLPMFVATGGEIRRSNPNATSFYFAEEPFAGSGSTYIHHIESHRVFTAVDNGQTVRMRSDSSGGWDDFGAPNGGGQPITSLAVSADPVPHMLVGTDGEVWLREFNLSRPWVLLGSPPFGGPILDLSQGDGRLLAETDGGVFTYFTSNSTGTCPPAPVWCSVPDAANSPAPDGPVPFVQVGAVVSMANGSVLAAADDEVYLFSGGNWTPFASPLPGYVVNDLVQMGPSEVAAVVDGRVFTYDLADPATPWRDLGDPSVIDLEFGWAFELISPTYPLNLTPMSGSVRLDNLADKINAYTADLVNPPEKIVIQAGARSYAGGHIRLSALTLVYDFPPLAPIFVSHGGDTDPKGAILTKPTVTLAFSTKDPDDDALQTLVTVCRCEDPYLPSQPDDVILSKLTNDQEVTLTLAPGSYSWRAVSFDPYSYSPLSELFTFEVVDESVPTVRPLSTHGLREIDPPTLMWEKTDRTNDEYRVELQVAGEAVWKVIEEEVDISRLSLASVPELTLSAGVRYLWRVTVVRDGQAGPPSVARDFALNDPPSVLTGLKVDWVSPSTVSLKWNASKNVDYGSPDLISYRVTDRVNDGETRELVEGLSTTSFVLTGLEPGTHHLVSVSATDGYVMGKGKNATLDPPLATVNLRALFDTNLTAGVPLVGALELRSTTDLPVQLQLVHPPTGVVLDSERLHLLWGDPIVGDFTIEIDARVGLSTTRSRIDLRVDAPRDNSPPTLQAPSDLSATVGELWEGRVTASDADGNPIALRLLSAPKDMEVSPNGTLRWAPKDGGNQTISISASDGTATVIGSFTLEVTDPDPPSVMGPGDSLCGFLAGFAAVGVLILGVVGLMLYRRQRRAPAHAQTPTVATPQPPSAPGPSAASSSGGATTAMGGMAAAARPRQPAAGPKEVEPFRIEEVFVIYNDGRLIQRIAAKEYEGPDEDVVSSMLVAIQGFIKDSFGGREGSLDSFEFGGRKVVLVAGNHLLMALALDGTEPADLREAATNIVQKIEGLYAGVVEKWDGNVETFDLAALIAPLLQYHTTFTFAKSQRVRLVSALEFYQGYVRVKVGVRNETETSITDTALRLTYNREALHLHHTEPEYRRDGTTVEIGVLGPGEKKSVAFYLDPLICMESWIDGAVTYRDARGRLETASMKRRPADIVCPIFYTPSTVNVAMLNRLVQDLSYKDSKFYRLPSGLTAQQAFELAKGAVGRHDVAFIREFSEPEPYIGEGWFYGKTKEGGEELVVRTSVQQATGSLEMFVASGNLASLTGLLAELGHDLNKELTHMRRSGRNVEVTGEVDRLLDQTEVEAIVARSTLLLARYAESELGAAETDQ